MSYEAILFDAMTLLLSVSVIAWWSFVVGYNMFSKWYKNPYGRNVMSISAVVASIYTMLLLYLLIGNWTVGFTVVTIFLLLWSAYAAIRLIYLMDRVQRRGEK